MYPGFVLILYGKTCRRTTVVKFFTYRSQETGGAGCHAGAPPPGEAGWEAEGRKGRAWAKAFLWLSRERMSKAGFEGWANLGLNRFNDFSRLSATGKVPNQEPGPGVIRAEDYCLWENKSEIDEVFQYVGSGLVGMYLRGVSISVCRLSKLTSPMKGGLSQSARPQIQSAKNTKNKKM